ncbi:MAG: SLBB domain-containing protein [Gammaproteobacteria bacterium]
MIGTRAVVSLGDLRSIRVLIAGEALHPGSYTIGGLSTMSNALLASGGPTPVGSLRNIQLKRAGKTVSTLDLYDLLLHGDARNDARIQSGDVLFIAPVGRTAGITGEILRPAIYEFKGDATAADLVTVAGGLTPEAAPGRTTLERVDATAGRQLLDVDLTTKNGQQMRLQTGDILHVEAVRPTLDNAVTLSGHVYRPGATQFQAGSRLTDVIPGVDELRPNADLHYVVIRRELLPDRQVVVLSADLEAAWRNPASDANVVLFPRDRIIVFDTDGSRAVQLAPVLDDLRRQGTSKQPTQIVTVDGSVKMPGAYPLESGMRVSDLVRAGGSLNEAAFGAEAELARYEVANGETRRTEVREINLQAALAGDKMADVFLQPFDLLTIKRLPEWTRRETVTLEGEVRFPGQYAIRRGETLDGLLERAGGLTDLAFPEGVVFTRKNLKEREAQQINDLADRLERDLTTLAVQSSQAPSGQNSAQSLSVGQSLLASLRKTEPVGRLAIDLPRILRSPPGSANDILLKDDDRLIVPRRSQEVTVLGEVQTATSHLYQPSLDRDDYVNLSGGTTKKADTRRTYIVRANGQVVASTGSHWFKSNNQEVHPGDTIVVPVDTERLPPLPLWTSVTSIIYNLAVAVAAVNSF